MKNIGHIFSSFEGHVEESDTLSLGTTAKVALESHWARMLKDEDVPMHIKLFTLSKCITLIKFH